MPLACTTIIALPLDIPRALGGCNNMKLKDKVIPQIYMQIAALVTMVIVSVSMIILVYLISNTEHINYHLWSISRNTENISDNLKDANEGFARTFPGFKELPLRHLDVFPPKNKMLAPPP
jgi:hypothetical protein